MAGFTLDRLTAALRSAAGVVEGVDLDGDILDLTFDDLGYDSLGMLNTIGWIERDLSVKLPDDTVVECTTPRLLIEAVDAALATAQPA